MTPRTRTGTTWDSMGVPGSALARTIRGEQITSGKYFQADFVPFQLTTYTKLQSNQQMARVLVVDDDRDTLRLVQVRLERAGYDVLVVPSPQKALELVLEGELPDVVVLDVSMPEISGFEVLQTLRVGFGMKALPAVFLSGRVEPQEIERGQALGATYLTKPFVASALLKAIDQALKSAPPM